MKKVLSDDELKKVLSDNEIDYGLTYFLCSNKSIDILNSQLESIAYVLKFFFPENHVIHQEFAKISYLDIILIQANTENMTVAELFNTVYIDDIVSLYTCAVPFALKLSCYFDFELYNGWTLLEYLILWTVSRLENYPLVHWLIFIIDYAYTNILNCIPTFISDWWDDHYVYFWLKCATDVPLFILCTLFIIQVFVFLTPPDKLKLLESYLIFVKAEILHYFYFMSRELKALAHTTILIATYKVLTSITFINYLGVSTAAVDIYFFYTFIILILYLFWGYVSNYRAFLSSIVFYGRSFSYKIRWVLNDLKNLFVLLWRFYIFLFLLNVCDSLDDFWDSYFIFSAEPEYDVFLFDRYADFDNFSDFDLLILEKFKSENSKDYGIMLLFTKKWMELYFWYDFCFFCTCLFTIVEETLPVGLMFYTTYLFIFEIHTIQAIGRPRANNNYFKDRVQRSKTTE